MYECHCQINRQPSSRCRFYLQIHVSIIGLDACQKFVVVADIDKDLGVIFDGLEKHRKRTRFEISGVFRDWCRHGKANEDKRQKEKGKQCGTTEGWMDNNKPTDETWTMGSRQSQKDERCRTNHALASVRQLKY